MLELSEAAVQIGDMKVKRISATEQHKCCSSYSHPHVCMEWQLSSFNKTLAFQALKSNFRLRHLYMAVLVVSVSCPHKDFSQH